MKQTMQKMQKQELYLQVNLERAQVDVWEDVVQLVIDIEEDVDKDLLI